MTRHAALIILLAACAGSAEAQGTIRTGEHGDYTRVVIPIGTERDFALVEDGRMHRVTLDPPGTFNTERVFDTLFTERVQAIESDGDVTLQLGCSCDILAYRYQDSFLVLDIYDAPDRAEPAPDTQSTAASLPSDVPLPADAPTVDRALTASRPYRPTEPLARDLLVTSIGFVPRLSPAAADGLAAGTATVPETDLERAEAVDAASPESREVAEVASLPTETGPAEDSSTDTTPVLPQRPDRSDAQLENTEASNTPDAMPDPGENLADAAEALAQQLARASAAGLLDTAAEEPFTAADPPQPATLEIEETNERVEGDPAPAGLPVRAANAFDVAASRDNGLADLAAALSCAQPIGPMENWSTGLGFEQELGALRQAAFSADGDLIPDATVTLARYYIYHGFGAEAEAWLLQLEAPPQTEMAMARYLDDRPGPNFPNIETLALCSGLDLLWRFVDAPDFPELALSQRQEMRLAFSGLPIGLRRLIGPDLVRRLTAEGYSDDAADVREALSRGPTLDEAEALVLEMETTDDRPTRREADALEEQLQSAGPDVARVMREYLAARRQAGDPPQESQLLAAEALLRETEPEFDLNGLWHEVLLARTASGNMETVFSMLDVLDGSASEARSAIIGSVVQMLLANRDDAAIVLMSTRLALEPAGPSLPRPLENAIYDRLVSLGLNTLAEPFGARPDGPGSLPPAPAQNWAAAAAGTEGPAAQIARRMAQLETPDQVMDPESPDDVRAALDDSRAMRAELSALLSGAQDN